MTHPTRRIMSGMQPTNALHIGNYLGALKNWVALQAGEGECLYCVVDLHAITVPYDPAQLAQATREVAAAFIAGGVDPARSIIFAQSSVPAHSKLCWLLATMTQIGKLNRMTQFKDKAGKDKEKAGLGLYAYPVLMAADVLTYHATHVPVGDDQRQHLELMREIADTFNSRYAVDFFPRPEAVITGPAPRVMSLRDGTKKMSKSDDSDLSRINLTDDADTIARKIQKSKTDPHPVPSSPEEAAGRPEALNLLTLMAAFSDRPLADLYREQGGRSFADFKKDLTDRLIATLAPMTARMRALMADPAELDRVLARGADRANAIAEPIYKDTLRHMGFWRA